MVLGYWDDFELGLDFNVGNYICNGNIKIHRFATDVMGNMSKLFDFISNDCHKFQMETNSSLHIDPLKIYV